MIHLEYFPHGENSNGFLGADMILEQLFRVFSKVIKYADLLSLGNLHD